jgi:hypothetical protein
MFPCFFIFLLSPLDNGSLTDYSRGSSRPQKHTVDREDHSEGYMLEANRCLNYFRYSLFSLARLLSKIDRPIRETSKIKEKSQLYTLTSSGVLCLITLYISNSII